MVCRIASTARGVGCGSGGAGGVEWGGVAQAVDPARWQAKVAGEREVVKDLCALRTTLVGSAGTG